ncbi:MAG: hypothetical protein ACAI38_07125 [Myxococcota bacterium]
MQVRAKPMTVRFTLHEATKLPGKTKVHRPRDFAAWSAPRNCKQHRSAYVLGGGPNGENGTQTFWMNKKMAGAFDGAVDAALRAGNYYVVNVVR